MNECTTADPGQSAPAAPPGEKTFVANLKGDNVVDSSLKSRRTSSKFVHCNLVENGKNCRRPAASSISKKRFARITSELKLNMRLRNMQFDTVNVCRSHKRIFYGMMAPNAVAETRKLDNVTSYDIVKAAILKMSPKAVRRYKKTYGIDVDSSLTHEKVTDVMVEHCLSQPIDTGQVVADLLRKLKSYVPGDSDGDEACD
uniref:Uncharacterized protein n=1 Tax=Trichuris muris TaxID=70415 RepID=A0A5S6QQZ6_TRIMR